MADSRRQRVTDPHIKWEAQRQALTSRYYELAAIPEDNWPDDYDEQLDEFDDAEKALIKKIKTTPTKTVEGALCVIEALDGYEKSIGLTKFDGRIQEEMDARASAVATIRRLTVRRKLKPRDKHPKWLRHFRRLLQEYDRRYSELDLVKPIPIEVWGLKAEAGEVAYNITHTRARTTAGAIAQLWAIHDIASMININPKCLRGLESMMAFLEERKG